VYMIKLRLPGLASIGTAANACLVQCWIRTQNFLSSDLLRQESLRELYGQHTCMPELRSLTAGEKRIARIGAALLCHCSYESSP
jgi:hypothetical protein